MHGEETTIGYIIREETIVNSENNGETIDKIKTEGEKVAKGDIIAKYYTVQKEELESEINQLDTEIQMALESESNIFSSDINALDSQIEVKLLELSKKNNIQDINENKTDINSYITKKAKISGALSPAGSHINSLMTQKSELERKMVEGSKSIVAPMAGVVSYRIDGLEDTLSLQNFDSITDEMLNNLEIKTGKIISTSNNIAKIVNNFKCYIVIESDTEDSKDAEIGDKLTLKFSTGEEAIATIEHINEQKKSRIFILKIIQNVEELIDYRKISVEVVWWRASGLKVPNSSIIYENGLSYVIKRDAGKEKKILVKITKENDKYSIVKSYSTDELINMGFKEEDINKMDKINLYDEILIDPSI